MTKALQRAMAHAAASRKEKTRLTPQNVGYVVNEGISPRYRNIPGGHHKNDAVVGAKRIKELDEKGLPVCVAQTPGTLRRGPSQKTVNVYLDRIEFMLSVYNSVTALWHNKQTTVMLPSTVTWEQIIDAALYPLLSELWKTIVDSYRQEMEAFRREFLA